MRRRHWLLDFLAIGLYASDIVSQIVDLVVFALRIIG